MIAEKYMPRYTIEDYKLWEGDWELIDGVPFAMTPSPFGKHQKITAKITHYLLKEIEKCKKSRVNVYVELDWIVNSETVVRPDVSVMCEEVEEYIKTPPEAVFEVVSKSTAIKDEKIKFELYRDEKVKYYVIVYPELKKVRAFELSNNRYEKIFDNDKGLLKLNLCKCDVEISVEKLFE